MLLRFPPWKVALVLATLLLGFLTCMPNLLTEQQRATYFNWWPTQPLKLGLDLRGGASISLEIDPAELRANELRNTNRAVGEKLRETPLIPVRERTPQGEAVVVRVSNPADAQRALDRLKTLGASDTYIIGQRADGAIEVKFTEAHFDRLMTNAVEASRQAVQRRADNSGLVEPNITKQGENRVLIEVPGLKPEEVNALVDTLTQAGVLTLNMVDDGANPAEYQVGVPRNNRVALPDDGNGGAPVVVMVDPIITGSDLSGARQDYDRYGKPAIAFTLHSAAAQKFGRATGANVGRRFAIVMDNRIISAPVINSPITGGSGIIEGGQQGFSMDEAQKLAVVLQSGQLPAKLQVVERRVVDASLGADSINAGVTASIVGVVLVAIFMIAVYGLLGVFAVMALICNMFMMIGVLSFFGATLTLPGIAGILLTMGMAVDYNVLIFERIREEKRAGRSPITSVEAGYEFAMATIIDANVTHLVAAAVMFNLGEGPVRGFALTLAIGVITSIFTAVIVARWIMSIWLRVFRPKWIPI